MNSNLVELTEEEIEIVSGGGFFSDLFANLKNSVEGFLGGLGGGRLIQKIINLLLWRT